jgi:tetratricopeptide (TPR) repeat protein
VRRLPLLLLSVILISCGTVSGGKADKPNDQEWNLLTADYQWLETLRNAQAQPPPNATRKQQIELALENLRKIEQPYANLMTKLEEYRNRTGDPRASGLMAKEKIAMGDQYMNVLSRYDRALDFYRAAQQLDPASAEVAQRIETAERRRFVSMNAFANVKSGMKEDEVRKLVGLPREDWIKQVVQNNRIYSVWIYPKTDGGASAVYFDNGVVYHTNWNAAAPASAPQTK